jgi:long-chain acyl-CoA synthetase
VSALLAERTSAGLAARFEAAAHTDDRPLAAVARGSAHRPHQPALIDSRKSLSFARLRAVILELAAILQQRGVGPGDRVMIAAENTMACVALLYAVQLLSAWPAILNPRSARAEVAALRDCCAPRLTVFAVDDAPAALELSKETGVDRWDHADVGTLVFEPTAQSRPEPAYVAAAEQVGLLIFTSGTLGLPKAVMLSHAALAAMGRVLAESRMTSAGDVIQGVAPLSHIMGMANLMSAMHAGAALKLMPRLELAELSAGIAKGDLTHLSFVPTVYTRLVDHIESRGIDLSASKLRYISCGGAPLDPSLKQRIERLFRLRLVNGYGMTECAPAFRTRPDRDAGADCIGWPERGVEECIVNADSDAQGIGELWLRSATMMMGYYNDEAQTAAALRPGGWLATGDLARRLPDGSVAIVGRQKEMIIRSGFNVYPAEVEAALNAIPQILQCGVVGVKAREGEEIVAFVQLREGMTLGAQAVSVALRERVAPYKVPTRIVFVDALPLGQTGKIWKARLQQMAASLSAAPN